MLAECIMMQRVMTGYALWVFWLTAAGRVTLQAS